MSTYRVTALVIAMCGHLMLVMLLLRPAGPRRIDTTRGPVAPSGNGVTHALHVVELRLFESSPSSSPSPPQVRPAVQPAVAVTPARYPRPSTAHATRTSPSDRPAVRPRRLDLNRAPGSDDGGHLADSDGGFRDRLRQARQAQRIRGVPGTDAHVVPSIRLTAPGDQGIGAVMRKMQRLFGVTSHACVDVDVWSNLSRSELADKHITPDQLKRLAERNHCNEPQGLHFQDRPVRQAAGPRSTHHPGR